MEESILLLNMTMLLLIGWVCSVIFKRLNMPAAIGYIISGIILSNYWGGENADTERIVSFLADLGLVLMMFCIGMELNLKKLGKMGPFAMMVVMIQVPIMLTGGFVGGSMLGLSALQAIIFGAIISGSSTAVVTIVLAEQERISHSDVETLVFITVIEDVAQVLILCAVSPLMSGADMDLMGLIWMLIIVIVFMVTAIVIGLMFVPRLLDYVGEKFSEEILLVVALGLCFGLSYISVYIGMSMAIGAFLMGVIVSQSGNHRKIERDVEPMRDIFMMMFFISIGLLIRPEDIANNIVTIVIIYLIYFVLKGGSVILAYFTGNKPLRLSFYCSISLIAMGEFAFIISKEAYNNGLITADFYASVIGAALMSMITLPLLNTKAEKIADLVEKHAPAPVAAGYMRLANSRNSFYDRLSLATKETMKNFRTRMTSLYFTVVLTVVVQIVFVLATPGLAEFLNEHTPASVSLYLTTTLVLLLDFLVLVPIMHQLVKNLNFLLRVFLDSQRKAVAAGTLRPRPRLTRFLRFVMTANRWIFIVLFDFLVLLLTPNNIDPWAHVLVAIAGVTIIATLEVIAYLRRS